MKLKLDECVVRSAAARLRSLGYDADSVREEGLEGSWRGCLVIASATKLRVRAP